LKLQFLGTGTSQGIPVIGCECATCLSKDPQDKRFRTSALISTDDTNILIDTSPDLRMQMLVNEVKSLDAIIYTHEHNDHVAGIDDVRPFNFMSRRHLQAYAEKRVMNDIMDRYGYIFSKNPYPGTPKIEFNPIEANKSFSINNIDILPIRVLHGSLPILGFKIRNLAYLTDVKTLPNDTLASIKNINTLVISALQVKDHISHASLLETLDYIKIINPHQAFLIHMSHTLGTQAEWSKQLPNNVYPAYDQLEITF
jgi:phosphoribosyl 1,2-cyclic phosphate phosphodiesterase